MSGSNSRDTDPTQFRAHLEALVSAVQGLAECARVTDHEQDVRRAVADEIVDRWVSEGRLPDPTAAQSVRATAHPRDWLTALRDLIGVLFEPLPAMNFFLNDNPGFVLDAIPRTDCRWFCVSRTVPATEAVETAWRDRMAPEIAGCVADGHRLAGLLVAAVTSPHPDCVPGTDFSIRLSEVTGSTLNLDEAVEVVRASGRGRSHRIETAHHAGVTCDPSMPEDRYRLSAWGFAVPETAAGAEGIGKGEDA